MLRDLYTRPTLKDYPPGPASYRFVLCVDIEDCPDHGKDGWGLYCAYRKLRDLLFGVEMGWETSDECYGPDGEAIDPAELQKAIAMYYVSFPDKEEHE